MEDWELEALKRTGLCARREPHVPHIHVSKTLGAYYCTGDPDHREPGRSERRRKEQQ